MQDGIQISRMVDRFSSNTLSRSRPAGCRVSADTQRLRERLIAATVAVISEGGDPRLVKTLALL